MQADSPPAVARPTVVQRQGTAAEPAAEPEPRASPHVAREGGAPGTGAFFRRRLTVSGALAVLGLSAAALFLFGVVSGALRTGALGGPAGGAPDANVVLFTNRQVSAMVVLRSLLAHSPQPQRLAVHVVVADASCCAEVLLFALGKRFGAMTVYTLGELTLELLEDGHTPAWTAAAAQPRSAARGYTVRQADWDNDNKHATPLNHARFYLPHMRFARGLRRLLFVDDDIVLQADVVPALAHPMAAETALLVSCNAINFDTCGWFRMAWDEMTYAQTTYFGFKAFDVNGVRREDVICKTPEQKECIEPGGLELLSDTAKRLGGPMFSHGLNLSAVKAWNFGFVVIDVRRWHDFGLTAQYEAWIAANAAQRIFAETSLGFGLGLPLLALAGRVECYSERVRIFEGLAVMDRFDMAENNLSLSQVTTAHVLHYTGEHKPWLPDRYTEYNRAFSRFDARLERLGADEPPRAKQLLVVLGGEHAGLEFLLARLDAHPAVCATGESKGALHALRSFARHGLMPPLPDMLEDGMVSDWVRPCTRQALCTWRHFARAVTAANDTELAAYPLRADMETWRGFWRDTGGNSTALFEAFMRAALGRAPVDAHGSELRLPCYCPAAATHVGFKFFNNWLQPNTLSAKQLEAHPWASNYHRREAPRALDVFKALGATFVAIERASPVSAYLSLQKSMVSGAWHCPTANCVPRNTTVRVDVEACKNYVRWYDGASKVMKNQLANAGVTPDLRIVYEDCINDQDACLRKLTTRLGVAPLPPSADASERGLDVQRSIIQDHDAVVQRCSAAIAEEWNGA